MSKYVFDIMVVVAILFLGAIVMLASGLKVPNLTQHGDSSLGRNSVNWLAGLAISSALLICLY